jgi:2'-5' RNA ligase
MADRRTGQLIRAFIAVTPGENMLSRLTSCIEALQAGPQGECIRWVRPENLHVTLRFVGNIPLDHVGLLQETLTTALAGLPAFELGLGPLGMFPDSKRPRVVAAALIPEEPLFHLVAAVEQAVRAAGLPGEERKFRPHLTLGRVRKNAPRSLHALADQIATLQPGARDPATPDTLDRISRVDLLESDLRPDGPVYTILKTIALN